MKAFTFAFGVATLIACAFAIPASADDITSPGGWFDGSGNPNGGFTVTSNNGITIGQRAKDRQDPNVITPTGNVYDVPAGPQTNPVDTSGVGAHAAWNYEFSIGCDAACAPGGLANLITDSTMTVSDLTNGHMFTVGMANWPDDTVWDSVTNAKSLLGLTDPTGQTAQNSENPKFSGYPLTEGGFAYDMNAADYLEFVINVYSSTDHNPGTLLDSDTMFVSVGGALPPAGVPEAASLAMFGGGLLLMIGLFTFGRRKTEGSDLVIAA